MGLLFDPKLFSLVGEVGRWGDQEEKVGAGRWSRSALRTLLRNLDSIPGGLGGLWEGMRPFRLGV